MSLKKETRFRWEDGAAIAAILLLALAILLIPLMRSSSDGKKLVRVYQNGQLLREVPLDQDAAFEVEGRYPNRVEIRDGRVRMAESGCPGEDCVHTGWIQGSGQSIFCLPNGVEIRIAGMEEDVDAVVR